MADKILMVTLAIRLSDFSDDERQRLASDIEVPLTDIRKLDDTPPADIAKAITDIGITHSDTAWWFARASINAEFKSVKVVSAAYAK